VQLIGGPSVHVQPVPPALLAVTPAGSVSLTVTVPVVAALPIFRAVNV
jgi:hypothetical protein